MKKLPSKHKEAIEQHAIDWRIRLHDRNFNDHEQFQRWYNSDPYHARQYAKVNHLWNLLGHITPSYSRSGNE